MNYKKIWSEVITVSLIVVISAIAIISFVIISDQAVDIYNPSSKIAVFKGSDKISEVLNLLQSKYMGEVDVDKLIDGAIEGIFNNIDDPYTRYLTEEEYDEEMNGGEEEYSGIGVHISFNTKTKEVKVIGVMPDSPAKKAGIKAGDIIVKVDDLVANTENYYEISNAIKGEPGTTVNITIKRNGKEINFNIDRQNIVTNNISSDIIDNIGYIKIFEFERGIYNDFKDEYNDLINDKKVKGLIIDLRNNPGGFVDETVKIADLLCGEGTIIKELYGDGTTKIFTSGASKCEVPLVILINENSASASEILAGAVKDLRAGTLVGNKTFGKGIMQSYIKLKNGGAVAITVAKYYTASGDEIHEIGITPDIEVKLGENETIDFSGDPSKDTQLKEALKVIKENN